MVGVAGKSKACHNCKKRRVKCDLGQPGCLRCAKAGLTCKGYSRNEVIFVNRTSRNLSTTVQDATGTNKFSNDRVSLEGDVNVVSEYQAMSRMIESSSYSTSIFRLAALTISQVLYLPQLKTNNSLTSPDVSAVLWFESICKLQDPDLLLDISLLAFSAAQLHATGYHTVSLDNAIRIYSDGLVKLSVALQQVDYKTPIYLIASIINLSTCELFLCPSDSGWRAHTQGIAEILRLHNTNMDSIHRSQDWLRLCARARMVTVLTDLVNYRTGSLTPQQWRNILTSHTESDELDEVLDIAHQLPGVFELEGTHDRLLVEMAAVLERMRNRERRFHLTSHQPLFVFVPSSMHNPADDGYTSKLFPNVLQLQSLKIARCLLVLWGATVQALDLIISQYHANDEFSRVCESYHKIWDFFRLSDSKHQSTLQLIIAESNRCAWLICRCVEYMYRVELGLVGHQSMIYATWVVTKHYYQLNMSRELAWCENISKMSGRGSIGGVQVMQFSI
ncbi:hypothetical protein FSST1_010399 [Fusarium sambucinum]